MDYRKLKAAAFSLRMAALTLEQAAQKVDDKALFIAYCEIVIRHEKIRDIVAGRD